MSNYFNNTQCGGFGDWKILEGTYLATPTNTPFTIYLDTATGTYTGYSSTGAAFPLGTGGAGGSLTPAQLAQLATIITKRNAGTAPVVGNVMIEGAGGLDNTSSTVTKTLLEGFDARITTAQTAATTFQTATQTSSTAIAADATHVAVPSTTTQGAIDDLSKAIKAIPASTPTTNTLTAATSTITSTVNGVAATITPATGTIASTLGFDSTGNLVKQAASASGVTNVSSATTELTVATGTSTPVLTIVSAPKLTTARTINGVAFDGTSNITIVDATKVASVTAGTNVTVTGTVDNPIINAVIPATTNTLANNGTNSLTSTVNGISSGLQPIINTVANTSTVNTLITTVNGVAGTGIPIVNTNVLAVTAGALTSTINGVASNVLTLPKSSYNLSYGYSTGNNTTGDQDLTEEIFTINSTITNAVLVIKSGTFPATATTLRIRAGATDYVTIIVPANQGVTTGTSLPCTIVTALIAGTSTTPIQTILTTSQSTPAVSFKIITTNQN